jgi:hypothetical protein
MLMVRRANMGLSIAAGRENRKARRRIARWRYGVFERSGYRFAQGKRVKTKV